MLERVKEVLIDNCLLVAFMFFYLTVFSANTLAGMRFILQDLNTLAWLLGGQHGINSLLNTPVPFVQQFRGGSGIGIGPAPR